MENVMNAAPTVSLRPRVWSMIGKTFSEAVTPAIALKECNADWMVEGRDLFYPTAEWGKLLMENKPIAPQDLLAYFRKVGDKKANVRMDSEDSLGIVGKDYGIVQNTEAFDFIEMLTTGKCGGDIPTIEAAGVLGCGERIFVTAKLPEPIRIANSSDDLVDMYFVFTTTHDGSGAVNCMVTPIRVYCQNTLNMAFKNNCGKLSFRHTMNIGKRLDLTNKENADHAFRCMHLYHTYKEQFESSLQQLASIRVDDDQVENILVNSLLTPDVQKIYAQNGNNILDDDIPTRSQNIIMNVTEALHSGIGQRELATGAGNGLWLINGVTTYYQNNFDWKDDTERKFDAVMEGSVQKKLQNAYENILRVA